MNKLILGLGLTIFIGLVAFALYQELDRNEQELQEGITGAIQLAPGPGSELDKTDNAYIFLYAADGFLC